MTGRWVIGPTDDLRPGDQVVALDLVQFRAAEEVGARTVPFHVALSAEPVICVRPITSR
jgi:hypothetical protein